MLSDFPEKLARARKNAGFTQKEIERALNIKQSAIASYESGRSRPTYENLVKLADFYNVTCDWLLKAFGGSIKLDTMTEDEIEMIKSILK